LGPIRTEAELDRATTVLNRLLDRDELDADEDDYLDVLSDLIRKYERTHHPIEPASAADRLRHLLDSRGLSQAGLARATGIAESTISGLLSDRREFNLRQIESLARYFHVRPRVFLQ
jgi:HTH-type transcriptional regulator/antitoxin HigA